MLSALRQNRKHRLRDPFSLYVGKVMHQRMKPRAHRFTYDVFSLVIDLDRLAEAQRASAIFSVDRFNLLSFRQQDHGGGTPDGLADYIRSLLAPAGAADAGKTILLLCYPRVLGYVFNPLTVYYCLDANGRLGALVYEVSNTFGQRHTYVAPVTPNEAHGAEIWQARDKLFYVSPFLDMAMRYKFRVSVPDDLLRLRILEEDCEGPILSATFAAERQPAGTWPLLKAFASVPLMTIKVVAAIHFEAARLWLKGVRLVERPAPPHAVSYLPAKSLGKTMPLTDHSRAALLSRPEEVQ